MEWRIFRRAVSDELTEKDQKSLDDWLSADMSNRNYFKKAIGFYSRTNENKEIDYRPAFAQFMRETKNKSTNYLRIFQVAASIILLLASGWLGYVVLTTEQYQSLNEAQLITAKEGQVELVLSSGKSVLLAKQGEESIKEKLGEIKKKNGVVNYLSFHKTKQKILQYNTVKVPRGSDFKLVLSDSTVVWLNAESSITYPVRFAEEIRNVSITGEAYFDVAHDKTKPFVVDAGGTKIKVLGTEFNVNAYRNEDGIFTTLIEGSVAVANGFGATATIKPNEQARTNSTTISVKEVDVSKIIDWRKGLFDFEDEPLVDILDELARWYDFKIFFETEELKNYQFTGSIERYEDMNQLLKLFEMTKSVQFFLKDDALLVRKAPSKNKRKLKSNL